MLEQQNYTPDRAHTILGLQVTMQNHYASRGLSWLRRVA